MLTLFNSPVITDFGVYKFELITTEYCRLLLQNSNYKSFIGHQETCTIIKKILGVDVECNRGKYRHLVGDKSVVFIVKGERPNEGAILSEEDIIKRGYEFGLLTRLE